ncbi:hypothetical protein [Mycobacterium sp. AZCC_0083]|uniref:hypothetical protein n=1 Tax=Mycobacterium sp. AZCC_0083 TaxID=2735882 RepID=UPI0016097F8C|nr:hypothetical protein [Mycobacterium sp. AZCC_0083]MBB5162773.1 hypothetical protein [Mycobacterium sp. AZCC_0083]
MPAGRALSTAFGLLMVAATALVAEGPSLVGAALAVVAVAFGIRFAGAATLAVTISVVVALLADAPPMSTALAGIAAAAYLVLRYSSSVESVVTAPTVVGALGFSAIGLGATVIPVSVPWLPLAAPVAVLVSYVIVVKPLLAQRR